MENPSGKSAIGLDSNLAAAIGYPIGLLALILVFIEKDNKFVRFHAIQSLLWGLAMVIAVVALLVVGLVLGFGLGMVSSTLAWTVGAVFTLLYIGWFIALFGGIIYAAIKAYGNQMTKLPLVGNFAEKWSN